MSLPDESPQAVEARAASYLLGTYAFTKFHPREGRGARLVDANGKIHFSKGLEAMVTKTGKAK